MNDVIAVNQHRLNITINNAEKYIKALSEAFNLKYKKIPYPCEDGDSTGFEIERCYLTCFLVNENEIDSKILWIAQAEKFLPGVRYYKDGSGEPDSYDIIKLGDLRFNAVDAFKDLINYKLQEQIDLVMENLNLQDMYNEYSNEE